MNGGLTPELAGDAVMAATDKIKRERKLRHSRAVGIDNL
jgi:hypothetical protein